MEIKFTLNQIDNVIKKHLIPRLKECRIFTFKGPLGVGKTTIIKQFLQLFGIKDVITSPTFNYLNVYKIDNDKIFYHFDLYRLDSLESFLNLGFDEYLYSDSQYKSWCLIEWPEIIETLLKDDSLKKSVCNIILNFDLNHLDSRIIRIN